jgi:hypothetical protein
MEMPIQAPAIRMAISPTATGIKPAYNLTSEPVFPFTGIPRKWTNSAGKKMTTI